MRRGRKTSAEQVVRMLRHIEVQTAQGKSLGWCAKSGDLRAELLPIVQGVQQPEG